MGFFDSKHAVVRTGANRQTVATTRTQRGAKSQQKEWKEDVNVDTDVVTPPPCRCGRRAWPCCDA